MINKRAKSKQTLGILFTIFTLFLLFFSAPAQAVTLSASVDDSTVNEGDDITISTTARVETSENVPFSNFTIRVIDEDANTVDFCTFDITGAKLDCGSDFGTITATDYFLHENNTGNQVGSGYGTSGNVTTTFGDGFGYGYDSTSGAVPEVNFSVTWTTPSVSANTDYTIRFEATADGITNDYTYLTENDVDITVGNVVSSGGGSGSGGSSSGGGTTTAPPQAPPQTLVNKLGLDSEDVKSITQIGQPTSIQEELSTTQPVNFENLPQEVKTAVEELLQESNVIESSVVTTVTSYAVTDNAGKKTMLTLVQRVITVTVPKGAKQVEVVEVIPKSVAVSAGLIKGNFTVIEDDPVISFSVPVSEIVDGKATIKYSVEGDVKGQIADSQTVVVTEKTTKATATKPQAPKANTTTAPVESNVTQDATPQQKESGKLIIWMFVALIVLIAGGWYFMRIRQKPDGIYIPPSYN